jgi:arylsulfatase
LGVAPGKDGWPGKTKQIEIKENELYDLRRDPGENYNIIDQYPEIVRELLVIADKARKDLGDDQTKSPGENRRKAGTLK